jgi:hypothetical protein
MVKASKSYDGPKTKQLQHHDDEGLQQPGSTNEQSTADGQQQQQQHMKQQQQPQLPQQQDTRLLQDAARQQSADRSRSNAGQLLGGPQVDSASGSTPSSGKALLPSSNLGPVDDSYQVTNLEAMHAAC